MGRKIFIMLTLLIFSVSIYSMESSRFNKVLKQVEKAGFEDEKLTIIETALSTNSFKSEQVKKIVDKFSFASGKLKALKILSKKIEDPENKDIILDSFSFSSDKKKGRKILSSVKKYKKNSNGNSDIVTLKKVIKVNHSGVWEKNSFNKLVNSIKKESFSKNKLTALKNGIKVKPNGFSSSQIIKILKNFSFSQDMVKAIKIIDQKILGMESKEIISILDTFSFSKDKLTVLKALKNTITDAENKFSILNGFTFVNDKKTAKKILESVKPRSFIYGNVNNKKVLFIVDISGSMETRFETNKGNYMTRLEFVIYELKKVLKQQIDSSTKFDIIVFNGNVKSWQGKLISATPNNISKSIKYLNSLKPSGATNIYGALKKGYSYKNVDKIYFLTDGTPTAGAKKDINSILAAMKKWDNGRGIPINATAFLIGTFLNDNKPQSKKVMKKIATSTSGVYRSIE